MVATVASAPASNATSSPSATAKKCPPNIRTGSVPAPVLVSPISVAHGNTMAGSEGGKKGANWMRDQWVANLKKKRMTTGEGDSTLNATASVTSVGTVPVVKAGIRAEASRSASDKPTKPKRTTKSKTVKAAPSSDASAVPALDKEGLSLMQSAMFFNDLGCFELESPSFMRLTPTMRDGSGTPLSAMASPAQASAALKADKKWMKPLMKKRSSCFSAESNSDPKRRTPRRPHSHGGSFDESDTSSQHSYTSVGTPSNFNSADVARMWGPELDFPNGYVDTFLDLPTPKSTVGGGAYLLSTPTALSLSRRTDGTDELEQPKLIRTTSIEQEGLSHFFEQTTLGAGSASEGSRTPSTVKPSGFRTPRQAAACAVDDYFGKIAPSPAHYAYGSARCFQPTPKGAMRHASRDYSFDGKKATINGAHGSSAVNASSSSEFDSLVQEYEFTDFDQELDTFYLDSIESFGSDMDLISS